MVVPTTRAQAGRCQHEQLCDLGSQALVDHAAAGTPQGPGLCPSGQDPTGRACLDCSATAFPKRPKETFPKRPGETRGFLTPA